MRKLRRRGPAIPGWMILAALALPAWGQGYVDEPVYEGEFVEEPAQEEFYEGEYFEGEAYIEDIPPQDPPPMPQPVRPVPRRVQPPEPVRPRTAPPTPRRAEPRVRPAAAMDEEKSGLAAGEPISFDFHEAPLYEVIESIARLTGRNFDVDPNIGATTVTVITHDKIPPELAFEVMESILSTRGFSMVETLDGHLIKIIQTPEATQSDKTPLIHGHDDMMPGYDGFATHIVQVQYSDAAELANALSILGSRNASIDTYVPTNTLIITDTADGLRRMFTFLSQVDIPGFDTVMEIYTLEFTRAEVLSTQLEQVLMDDGVGAARRAQQQQPQQPVRPQPTRPVRPTVPGATGSQVIGTREEVLRMVPDERLNALIVVATESMMERVRDLVRRLDTPTPYEANNLHIYQLLNADAEMVEQALEPLIGGAAPRRQAAAGGGQPAGGGGGGGGGVTAEVQPFELRVQITRYQQSNSLLIVASPQDYKVLQAFIARLDVPQRQVHVEAVVMDVTVTDEYGVTVDAAKLTGHSGFGLTNTAEIAGLAQSLAPAADAANQIIGGPQANLALGILNLGTGGGLTAGVFDDIEVTVNNQRVKIPFVPLLFQAVEQVTDVEVLSQPSLVTVDNEAASIVVGQEVPFITSTQRGLSGTGTGVDGQLNPGFGFTRVERQEVGVKLNVTPQISDGDYVLLELEIEVSDTDATQIGTVDILGPTTNKSLITNRVVVKDGSTAVIAGLIRDSATRSRRQPPVLGDLPVLGVLFRSRSDRREKRNMVVLVTPHIVKDGVDLDRTTQYKVDEYHDMHLEMLFQEGFFRKVKTKYDQRRDHRPTIQRSEALTGRRGAQPYGRGDIKR